MPSSINALVKAMRTSSRLMPALLVLMLSIVSQITAVPEPPPGGGKNIAWVSFHAADDTPSAAAATAGFTKAPDVGFTDLIKATGHNVTRVRTSGTPDAAALNAFDLVIISRSVPSADYQSASETAAWNSITAPTILMGGYILRANRLGFTTGNTIPDTAGEIKLDVNVSAHPIFEGVALDAGQTMANPFADIVTYTNANQRGISVNTSPVAGGGTVLATVGTTGDPTAGGMIIGEWPAGATLNNRGDTTGGRRLVFLSGSREASGLTSEGAGIYDLKPDGAKLFLNAVAYMTGPEFKQAKALLSGAFERPKPVNTSATGSATLSLVGDQLSFNITYSDLSGTATAAHIHGPATADQTASPMINFATFAVGGFGASGTITGTTTLTPEQVATILDRKAYVNIHTAANPGGEIRGQVLLQSDPDAELPPPATIIAGAPGVHFNFNTPGQFDNNFQRSINGLFAPFTFLESDSGGVGGSPAIDFSPQAANIDSTAVFTEQSYDFSANGAVLTISAMVKVKAPSSNNRLLQLGFLNRPSTLTGERLTSFMSARADSTAQPALTYRLRSQSKVTVGTSTIDGPQAPAVTLAAGTWYLLSCTFTNIKDTVANSYSVSATLQNMGADGQTPGAEVSTLPTLNVANANIVNDSSVYAALRGFNNAGADLYDNFSVNSRTGPIAFTMAVPDQTIEQGRPATFSATVDGSGPYTYQWFADGAVIPGATDWRYTIPAASLAQNGVAYNVRVAGANVIASWPAVLTVTPDTTGPTVLSAGSLDGATIGVCFSEPVDSASATDPSNYTIVGGVPVSNVELRPDGQSVTLFLRNSISSSFTVEVSGVNDLFGNAVPANSSASGNVASHLTSVDIGGPLPTGSIYTWGDGTFEIVAGGADAWGNADQFRFTYQQVTGDFDLKTLVTDETFAAGSGGHIVKAGLMARETLDAGSATVDTYVMPQFPGLNRYEAGLRAVPGGGTGGWGVNPAGDPAGNGNIAANHPTSWIRLRRAGNTFAGYTSANGTDWELLSITAQPFQDALLVGMMMTSHSQGFPASAEFHNYGSFAGYPGAVLGWETNITPASASINAGQTASFSVFATNDLAPSSEILYTWQRAEAGSADWVDLGSGYLSGANTFALTTPPLYITDNGAMFRAIAKITGAGAITSAVATVTVTDTSAPNLISATIPSGSLRQILLRFSEPVSNTATETGNYAILNSALVRVGVSTAVLFDPRSLLLTTTSDLTSGNYAVVINNLQDISGNTIASSTVATFAQGATPPLAPIVMEFYGGVATAGNIGALTNHVKFLANTPDWTQYSGAFGVNAGTSSFPNTLDHYGVRMFSYFVPPADGTYKFYIRGDNFVQFLMNTNAVNSTDPVGAKIQIAMTGSSSSYASSRSVSNDLVGGQRYYIELRFKESTGGDGATLAVRTNNSVPGSTEVAGGNFFVFPSDIAPATPAISEVYKSASGNVISGIGTLPGSGIADLLSAASTPNFLAGLPEVVGYQRYFGFSTNLANTRQDNYIGRIYSYFVAPSNGVYRFWIRSDDASQFYMNTNAANSTDPAGKKILGQLNGFTANYTLAAEDVSLAGGQRYYIEGVWKEGTGGDGMTVAIRAQSDTSRPPNTEVIPGSQLEFPAALARVGPVNLAGIMPSNPAVTEGATVMLSPTGVSGALPYGFTWLKNGQVVLGSSAHYSTPPLTIADNGAVYTLVLTNEFSRVERSTTVTVTSDVTRPTIVGASGNQYRNQVTLIFSEAVDENSAENVFNYSISDLAVLGAERDPSGTKVALTTTPQIPGGVYTVAVQNVTDASPSRNAIADGTSVTFIAWVDSPGFAFVEIFTGIPGNPVFNLQANQKFMSNLPDESGYVPNFSFGTNPQSAVAGSVSNFRSPGNLDNYGVRVSAWFTPATNGTYRFYIRGDDGTQLFMNTSGPESSGKVLIARNDGANSSAYNNGLGGSQSPAIQLTGGARYYLEALMKEGGGGDYVTVAFRPVDASGNPIGGVPPNTEVIPGIFLTTAAIPPTTQPDFLETTEDMPVSVATVKLLANDVDNVGGTLSVLGVSSSSQGAIVTLTDGVVTYVPKAGFVGQDSFTYKVLSSAGPAGTGTVNVTVKAASLPSENLISVTRLDFGVVVAQFLGIPGRAYTIQASSDMKNWTDVGTVTANNRGIVLFIDTEASEFQIRFYRTATP